MHYTTVQGFLHSLRESGPTSSPYTRYSLINARRACAARVTVVGSVCLCVCPLRNISPLERLFVSQSVPHTQRAAKVKNFVWFSLKMLRCRARVLPSLYGYALVGHFYSATYARAHNDRCAWAAHTWCTWLFCEKTPGVCELLLIMPPSNVCPQCQVVVPSRLKVIL